MRRLFALPFLFLLFAAGGTLHAFPQTADDENFTLESVTIANPVLFDRPDPDPFAAETSSSPAATPGAQKSTTLSSYTTWNAGHDPVRSAPYTETSASRHAPRRRSSH